MAARARTLVLTEDSGRQAQPTLQKLLKEALKLESVERLRGCSALVEALDLIG
jgi:hypothetical protein